MICYVRWMCLRVAFKHFISFISTTPGWHQIWLFWRRENKITLMFFGKRYKCLKIKSSSSRLTYAKLDDTKKYKIFLTIHDSQMLLLFCSRALNILRNYGENMLADLLGFEVVRECKIYKHKLGKWEENFSTRRKW